MTERLEMVCGLCDGSGANDGDVGGDCFRCKGVGYLEADDDPMTANPEAEAMSFCYALLGARTGEDAAKVWEANPGPRAAAHRWIYERKPRDMPYDAMMDQARQFEHQSTGAERSGASPDTSDVPASGWRSIEGAPRDGTVLWLLFNSDMVAKAVWAANGEGFTGWLQVDAFNTILLDCVCIAHPTHWQPLPAPPEGSSSVGCRLPGAIDPGAATPSEVGE